MAYTIIFLLKKMGVAFAFAKATPIFFQQKYLWIRYSTTRIVNILTTNELINLTTL